MKHFSEDELIAYQLHESDCEGQIREHLESCLPCAAVSDAIAETLRVYSADPVPEADMERSWQRVRGNLTVLEPAKPGMLGFLTSGWKWAGAGLAVAVLVLVAVLIGLHSRLTIGSRATDATNTFPIKAKGPLTAQPLDPAIANHLDAAERLLTEVSHASGPLDDTTRGQAHDLLLKNAVYVQTAHEHGDLAEAAVLDNLGRVLISIDHSPEEKHSAVQLRIEMNTDGLLLDLRILRQNDDKQ